MSRNRFFCLAIVALFTLALSGCKSNNSTGTTSSASPSSNDMSASSANNAASANNATSASNSMSSMMGSATNLVSQLGGKEKLDSLSSSFLGNVKSNPTTSNMVSGQDTSSLTSKLSDQLNSMLGGGTKAPLTNEQIDAASKKNTPETNSALSDSFSKSLDSVTSSQTVKDMINKTVGPKIGGILTGLLQK